MIFRQNHWSAHILIAVTGVYCLGITLSRAVDFPYGPTLLCTWLLCALTVTLNYLHYRQLSALLLALAFLTFGIVYGERAAYPHLKSTHLVHKVGEGLEAVIIGRLAAAVTIKNNSSKARIEVSHIRSEPDSPFSTTEGTILIRVKGIWPVHISPGDQVMVRAFLHPPTIANTPGTFNYREYLARDSIFITGTVEHPVLIAAVTHSPSSFLKRFNHTIERIRSVIGNTIDSVLPRPASAIYKALIIGDRTGISPDIMDIFKKTGTMHLLAVSGMHTGLIAAALFLVINWAFRQSTYLVLNCNVRKVSLLATLPPLFFYALLTGAQPPVVRSVIMLGVFVSAFSINRLHRPLYILSTAAFAILLYDPTALFSSSFQLSFVAVASLLVGIPRLFTSRIPSPNRSNIHVFITRIGSMILAIGAATIVATIGTIPLMIHHFNYISPFALPANLLIQPLICFWSLPLGIGSTIVSWLAPELSVYTFQAGALGINGALSIGSFFAETRFSQIWLPGPSFTACILYYFGLLLLVLDLPLKTRILCSAPLLIFSVCSMLQFYNWRSVVPSGHWSISVIDVGHGSANVVEMSNGYTALIDGGAKTSPGYDCGERTIAPFLWNRAIIRVNDIIITHDDADHYNGIPAIIERFRPERLFLPPIEQPKIGLRRVIDYATRNRVSVVTLEQNKVITKNGETLHLILADAGDKKNPKGLPREKEDDSGLIVRFESGDFSMLFPGDISAKKELDLIESGRLSESTVLLSAHHGSSTSNSYRFFEALKPDYLIFSAGVKNNQLFPSHKALKNADSLGIETHTTSLDGTFHISSDRKTEFRIEMFNRSAQRYYRTRTDMQDSLHLSKIRRWFSQELQKF